MPLDSSALANEIMNNITSQITGADPRREELNGVGEALWNAVAAAVVDHIQQNAQVVGTVTGGGSSGGQPIGGTIV